MRSTLSVAKALGDESRLRAFMALRGRELCVCQLVELLGLAHSTVSKHLSVLEQAGVVECEKRGRWRYYRLSGDEAPSTVREAAQWVIKSLAGSPAIRQDAKRLKEILKIDPEILCRRLGQK